jgi:HD-like signal output (HDOD) protein
MHVMRIAGAATVRPAQPLQSMQQTVAWLGIGEIVDIAFTVALQGKLLNVPGQRNQARRLWRHSLASGLWARHLGHMLAQEVGLIYLCGLLHGIGKIIALGAVQELVDRAHVKLSSDEYDRLIATFHHHIGAQAAIAWSLPPVVAAAISQWQAYEAAESFKLECNIVNVAHRIADCTLGESTALARDLLIVDPAYTDLGLRPEDGLALFDAAGPISLELDRYLAP